MMRTVRIAAAISILLTLPAARPVFGEEPGKENRPATSIYVYSNDDIPAVFFFPKEKARWDGSRVTMKEWYMLTDLQKEKFISEYVGELKKQYGQGMDVTGLDYLRALNLFSYYADDRKTREEPTKFIDALLKAQGKTPQAAPATDRQAR